MKVYPKMKEIESLLLHRKFEVHTPSVESTEGEPQPELGKAHIKARRIREHLHKIEETDAILVVNETQKGIKNYIGANAFLEMGVAFALKKSIYLLNEIPDQPNEEEIRGLLPIVLHGDLAAIHD